jgi:hypothetical protein
VFSRASSHDRPFTMSSPKFDWISSILMQYMSRSLRQCLCLLPLSHCVPVELSAMWLGIEWGRGYCKITGDECGTSWNENRFRQFNIICILRTSASFFSCICFHHTAN